MIDSELVKSIRDEIDAGRLVVALATLGAGGRVVPSQDLGPTEIVLVVGSAVYEKLEQEGAFDAKP